MAEKRAVDVGTIDDFKVGEFRILEIERREIGVIRLPNGDFRAVLNLCPHKQAPICKGHVGGTWPPCAPGELSYEREGEILVCPWHGFEYDLTTGVELYRKNATRLRLFPVSVTEDRVLISV